MNGSSIYIFIAWQWKRSIICLISNIIKLAIKLKNYQIFLNQCYQKFMSNSLCENVPALFNDILSDIMPLHYHRYLTILVLFIYLFIKVSQNNKHLQLKR